MRIYEVTGDVSYGTALGIVAANNQAQAIDLIRKDNTSWSSWVNDISATCLRGVTTTRKKAQVLTSVVWIE